MLSTPDQILAVALVGETADGDLRAVVQTIATHYNYDARYPGMGLDLLYVQRDLIKVALGTVRGKVSKTTADQRIEAQQEGIRLQAMLAGVEAEIATRFDQARGTGRVAVGQLRATNPVQPPYPAPFPDANSQAYSGSPYVRAYQPQKN